MKVSDPLINISVIMPIYNTAQFLKTALDSILDNDISNIEIILINDGSTDNSENICLKYVSKYENIRYYSQTNSGQGTARNFGVSMAKGTYIYFMDSDDYLESNALDKLYAMAVSEDLEGIFFDAELFYDSQFNQNEKLPFSNKKIYQRDSSLGVFNSGQNLLSEFTSQNNYTPSPCLYFIKREIIVNNGLKFPAGIIHEDEYFMISLLLHLKKCKHINERLFYRRVREGSTMTTKNNSKSMEGYATVILLLDKRINDSIFSNNYNRQMYLKLLYSFYSAFLKFYNNIDDNEKLQKKELIDETLRVVKNKYRYFNWRGFISTVNYPLFLFLSQIKKNIKGWIL